MNKKILLAAALPMLFAACSEESFNSEVAVGGHDNLGQLIEAPLLGGGVEQNADTKIYQGNTWKWLPETDGSSMITGVNSIGLCWTGVNNNADGYPGPTSTTGPLVYTNVKFDHAGWLYTGQEDVKLHCGELVNGEFHNGVVDDTPQATPDYADRKWTASGAGTLDMTTGVFKSQNGTIYEGEYIVYSPYNPSFWNAPVTAQQERLMDLTIDNGCVSDPEELLSKYAFNVGYKRQISGGADAAKFTTYMLTSGIKFSLTADVDTEIKEIVLWSKGEEKFITSQALSAEAIKKAGANLSKDIYLTDEAYKKINAASSTMVVRTNGLKVTSSVPALFTVPLLPEDIKDLQVLIVNEAGQTAVLDFWKETGMSFAAGKSKSLKLNFVEGGVQYKSSSVVKGTREFLPLNYAYDNDSFLAAYTKAEQGTTTSGRTVVMLDDIELTASAEVYGQTKKPVYVESDPSFDATRKNVLTLGGNKSGDKVYSFRNTDFDVNIVNNPKGCCNQGSVNLRLYDSSTAENTDLTLYGAQLELWNSNNLKGSLNSKFEPKDEEGEEHPDRVPVVYVSSGTTTATAGVLNEGKMYVQLGETPGKLVLDGAMMENAEGASIEVKGEGETAQDGVIRMEGTAKLTNKGDIYNHGNIDNNSSAESSFVNNAGATFTDYVGSTLSGHRIENKGEFISEVNSLVRYNNAIDPEGIRPTTIVRFVFGDDVINIGSGKFTTTYTLEPQAGKDGIYVPYDTNNTLIKFESCIDRGNTLTLNHAKDGTTIKSVKIGNLTVKSGQITIEHEALYIKGNYEATGAAQNTHFKVGVKEIAGDLLLTAVSGNVRLAAEKELNVTGDIVVTKVSGTDHVMFEQGSKVNAANMTVKAGQMVTFKENNVTKLGSKGDKGVLTNDGSINIVNTVTGSNVAAKVWCNKRLGSGTYANNSYPQYY